MGMASKKTPCQRVTFDGGVFLIGGIEFEWRPQEKTGRSLVAAFYFTGM
jgi:hypothetical protein